MAVYIKGMEMPKNCWECMFEKVASSYADGLYGVCSITDKHIDDGQEDWCPLVPVPDHGDLIDANTMIGVELYDECREEWYEEAMTVWEYLGHASTANVQIVIPADRREELL